MNPGGGSFIPIVVGSVGGFAGGVALSVSGLPSNYFYFSPASFFPNGSGYTSLAIQVPGGAPPNQYPVTVTGTSGSVTHSIQFTLSVTGTGPRISIVVSPGSQTIAAGNATSYTVTVNSSGGFSGTVALSVSGLPGGFGASFTSPSVVPPNVSTLNVTTPSNASGTYFFTITGTGGGQTSSTSATLVVNSGSGPPLQTITTFPPGLSLTVDGVGCVAPCKFQWAAGSGHTIGTAATQAGAANTQYLFSNWPDGGAITHTVTAQSAAVTYTANFATQYFLTTAVSTAVGGNISPASAWHNSGEVVTVSASANGVQPFTGFSGDLSGTTPTQNLSMTGPKGVTASFGPDFALSAVPVQTIFRGQNISGVPLGITSMGGFSATVNLNFMNLPLGLTASFAPAAATTSTSIAVSVAAGTPSGAYPLNFSGAGGGVSHIGTMTVVVGDDLPPTSNPVDPTDPPTSVLYTYNNNLPTRYPGTCTGFSCTNITSCVVSNTNSFPLQVEPNVTAAPLDETAGSWTLSITANSNASFGSRFVVCYFTANGFPRVTGGNLEIVPTVTITGDIGVPLGGTTDYNVQLSSISTVEPIQLSIGTSSGTGSATFSDGTTSRTITNSQTVTVVGVTQSSEADNIFLIAQPARASGRTLARQTLSVPTVDITMFASSNNYPTFDNSATGFYLQFEGATLGPIVTIENPRCAIGVEFVGNVHPSGYKGLVVLKRFNVGGSLYLDQTFDGFTPQSGMDDTSELALRDDDPQSGRSGGNVFDLDAPGYFPVSGAVGRYRSNFYEYAVMGAPTGDPASSNKVLTGSDGRTTKFYWWSRSSCVQASGTPGMAFSTDVPNDNQAGPGTTNTNWNLIP